MLNEFLNGEQPFQEDAASAADVVGVDNVSQVDLEGSPKLGKFKNVEELIKSYNNLQSEFTKKCQTLNDVLKQKGNVDNVENTPTHELDDWQQVVDNFLIKYPQAKSFSKEIANVISSDKDLMSKQNSLELAFCKVLENENIRLNSLLNDNEYIVKNLSNENKEKIVKEYLSQINNNSPVLITSKGGNNVVATYKKPLSVNEAGELAKKLFK